MTPFNIDEQIESIQKEIAEHSKKLFEAQGMLRMALHIKQNCNVEPKESECSQ